LQFEDLALDLDRDLLGEVALLNGRGDLSDVANLGGQIGRQLVDVVGEILPGARRTQHICLATQAPLGADLASHPGDLAGKGVQLVNHAVDRVLQIGNLAVYINRDLLGKVAPGHGGGDLRDVADLTREVAGHGVDVVRQVFPGAGRPLHVRLAAQPALGTHLARHARDFGGEGVELIDHHVDGVLQLEDLALHLDRDLFGGVAQGDRGPDLPYTTLFRSEVAGHVVDVVRQVLPNTRDAGHLGLAAELTFRTDLARHPGDFPGEGVQLIDHDVDGFLELEDFAL